MQIEVLEDTQIPEMTQNPSYSFKYFKDGRVISMIDRN